MKKLIKNGKIATDSDVFAGDILIDGEKIAEVGKNICCDDDTYEEVKYKLNTTDDT